jgi:hypothetical protein
MRASVLNIVVIWNVILGVAGVADIPFGMESGY